MNTQFILPIFFGFKIHKSRMKDGDITDHFLVSGTCASQNFTTSSFAKLKILPGLSITIYENQVS